MSQTTNTHFTKSAWQAALITAFCGPVAGGLATVTMLWILGQFVDGAREAGHSLLQEIGTFAVMGVLGGYMFGFVPAVMASIAIGRRVSKGLPVKYWQLVAIAVAAVLAYLAILFVVRGGEGIANAPLLLILFLPGAIFSACFCRWLMSKTGILPTV